MDKEITGEQKLYVLLKYKKSRTRFETFQMKLIRFFNHIGESWENEARSLCEREEQIVGDEPNEEQLRIYKTRTSFHRIYPPYTQSGEVYLRTLWNKSPSNPMNWWRNKWVIGLTVSVLGLLVGLLQLLR